MSAKIDDDLKHRPKGRYPLHRRDGTIPGAAPEPPEPPGGVPVRLDLSPDNHPSNITGDDQASNSARAAMTAIYEAHGLVNDAAREMKDKGQLADVAIRAVESTLKKGEKATLFIERRIEALEGQITEKITTRVDPTVAMEIRAHYKHLPRNKKGAGSRDAFVEAGKLVGYCPETTAALLNAPSYLSGLSDENQEALLGLAQTRMAPELVAERDIATSGLERLRKSMSDFEGKMLKSIASWQETASKSLGKLREIA